MLQASSGLLGNSSAGGGDSATIITTAAVAAAVNLTNEGAGGSGGGGGVSIPAVPDGFGKETRVRDDEGDRNFAGNRWPRDETLALLKIRSDMDAAFRDSPLKAPLWDEVSRRLAELGYHRNAKKCKEKFENIYKYHKRTKECRSGRQDSKNYRFFEQLELLDGHQHHGPSLPPPPQIKTQLPSAAATTIKPTFTQNATISCPNSSSDFATSTSTSATTSSSGKESELNGTTTKKKRRRKMGDYFERLMKEVLEKQENLQNKFLEALEKCEKDRMEREEAWKMQELARMKREKDILAQERATSAAKDAAVIAFLQKISNQTNQNPVQFPENLIQIPNPNPMQLPNQKVIINIEKKENGPVENSTRSGSLRWPKAEVEALIRLRANMELQYQENGSPKGPLWEDISSSMKKLGYNRNAKRCKEKWENINKYFKRVKDSKKKRPEDSKTCQYFQMLESLYERKSKKIDDNTNNNPFGFLKPEDILMQMMEQTQHRRSDLLIADGTESENVEQNEKDDENEDDDDEENENRDNYQIVVKNNNDNNNCAVMNMN